MGCVPGEHPARPNRTTIGANSLQMPLILVLLQVDFAIRMGVSAEPGQAIGKGIGA